MQTFSYNLFALIIMHCVGLKCVHAQNSVTKTADSLFLQADWKNAKIAYEKVLQESTINPVAWNKLGFSNYQVRQLDAAILNFDKSLSQNPPAALKPFIFSRLAKIYCLKNMNLKAYTYLDSAVYNGYTNYKELDTLSDFNFIRNEERFRAIRMNVYNQANPCMSDPHHREFDFWVGEWNVFQTNGMQPTGAHSSIQMISGGCAILENWESPNSNGKSINFIDPVTNKWKQSWAGNYANGTQEFMNGEYREHAMRFDFIATGSNGQQVMGHLIFYNQGPNQVRQFNETSTDGGNKWNTNYDFTYVRKK